MTTRQAQSSPLSARPVQSPILVAVLLGMSYMMITLIGFTITADPRFLLVGAAMGPVVILLIPQLFQRSYDLLAPLNFIALSALFGVTLRTLYVVTVADRATRELLLLHEPPEFLIPAILLVNGALTCLVIGYLVKWPSIPLHKARMFRRAGWSRRRIGVVVTLLVVVGGVFVVLYVNRMGITLGDLGRFSSKRRLEVADSEYGYASLGYYLWGMSLLSYAFYILWTYLASSRRRLSSPLGVTTLGLGVLAVFPPFFTSSRTGVLVLMVYAAIIWNYSRRPLTGRWIAGAVLSGLLVVTIMAALRSVSAPADENKLELTAMALPKAVLGNRNWLGITKTAHLMKAVPSKLDYQKGKSFLTWLAAPVPRTLWPQKPVIRVGIPLGNKIFEKDMPTSGVPPGFIGELYLNFGYLGVFGGMLGLGVVLRLLYASFWPLLDTNRSALLIYTALVFPLSFTLVTTDLSGTVIEIGRSLITLGFVLPLLHGSSTQRTADPAAVGA